MDMKEYSVWIQAQIKYSSRRKTSWSSPGHPYLRPKGTADGAAWKEGKWLAKEEMPRTLSTTLIEQLPAGFLPSFPHHIPSPEKSIPLRPKGILVCIKAPSPPSFVCNERF
ncbi:hypothetical protein SK128_004999, partial [Halocaridina rubra]